MRRVSVFDILIFLYFLSLSGEVLNIPIVLYKAKVTHALGAFLFCFFLLRQKRVQFPSNLLAPAVGILCSLVVSAALSVYPMRCFGYVNVYLLNFVCYFILPYNIFMTLGCERVLRLYFLSFTCIGIYATLQVCLSLFGIYDPLALQRVETIARGQALTYEPSYYALYMTAYAMFYNAKYVFRQEPQKLWKLFAVNLFLFASTSTGVFFTYPVFCFICLFLAIFSFARMYVEKVKRRIVLFGLSLASIFGILSVFASDFFLKSFYKFFAIGFLMHTSVTIRWSRIVDCWHVFLDNFWFGVGVGGAGPYIYVSKFQSGNFPEGLLEVEAYDPTNILTEVLASLGFVGFCTFVWLAFSFCRLFKKAISNPFLPSDQRITGISLFLSLVMVVFVLQFNQGLFRPYIWVHAAITVAFLKSCAHSFERIARRNPAPLGALSSNCERCRRT